MTNPSHPQVVTTGSLSCRDATVQDANSVSNVVVQAWRQAYQGLMPQSVLDGLSEERIANRWRHKAQLPHGFRVLVCSDSRIVGACSGGAVREESSTYEGELYSINVHPQYWGCGAGPMLLSRAEQAMRSRSFKTACLWVHAENHRAQAFYRRSGWIFDGRERTTSALTGAPLREFCFSKELGASGEFERLPKLS